MKITKAVFPVAGFGTRFLPATKATPKEMLPIVDKPLIQYAVEEAAQAGIKEFIFITGKYKRSIEDHFDDIYELELDLTNKKKYELLKLLKNSIPPDCRFYFVRQRSALGLGDAISCAKSFFTPEENMIVILADDYIINKRKKNCLQDMLEVHNKHSGIVIAVEKIPLKLCSQYGVIGGEKISKQLYRIKDIVEKPDRKNAPSNYGIIGRYILPASIFDYLQKTPQGVGGEIQITDAIRLALAMHPATAMVLRDTRFDCGSKIGYLQATISTALLRPELKRALLAYLKKLKIIVK